MKSEFRGFIIGVILSCILLSSVVFADGIGKKIDVVFNKVNITVNGGMVEGDNILFDGTTYVPLRKIAEMLDKEVGWDNSTNTASINDKNKTVNVLPLPIVSQNIKTDGVYVGTTQSDKYHKPTCRWAEKILKENEIWFDSKEEAQEKGYKPCGVCKP